MDSRIESIRRESYRGYRTLERALRQSCLPDAGWSRRQGMAMAWAISCSAKTKPIRLPGARRTGGRFV